jgi:hypothetical protein
MISTDTRSGNPETREPDASTTLSSKTPSKRKAVEPADSAENTISEKRKRPRALDDADSSEYVDDPRGLDLSRPPVKNMEEAFMGLVKQGINFTAKAPQTHLDMPTLSDIGKRGGIHLRVATMCSGTDAPIFALEQIQESFSRFYPGSEFLRTEHVFSVEIVPFKQSWILRHTDAIVFRDLYEFGVPGVLEA